MNRHIIGYRGTPKKILIVDDDWANRSVLVSFLDSLNFEVSEAKNGQEALNKLRLDVSDLIITDLMMPLMDGFKLIKEIRKIEVFKSIKILVSSASFSREQQEQAIAMGGNGYLEKPVQLDILSQLLESHLNLDASYEEQSQINTNLIDVPLPQLLPSPELLGDLWELAQQSNLSVLRKRIEELACSSSAYDAFAQRVMQLSRQQNIDKLEAFLRANFIKSMSDQTLI